MKEQKTNRLINILLHYLKMIYIKKPFKIIKKIKFPKLYKLA